MFDVQLMGGIVLHEGDVAEMKTGEGKTFVASLALYLNALPTVTTHDGRILGQGVHLVTVNDYLAQRDAEWNRGVFERLGIDGRVHRDDDVARRAQGRLRGRRHLRHELRVRLRLPARQHGDLARRRRPARAPLRDRGRGRLDPDRRGAHAADHLRRADDGGQDLLRLRPARRAGSAACSRRARKPRTRRSSSEYDYLYDEKHKTVSATESGIEKVERALKIENLYDPRNVQLVNHLSQSLKAEALYKRDVDYVVQDGEVKIVDEFTGRIMEGRRWSEGLHQAVEAKEGVADPGGAPDRSRRSRSRTTSASTSKLAGMTGTAKTEEKEFVEIYGLEVVPIPTNVDVARDDKNDLIFKTIDGEVQRGRRPTSRSATRRGSPSSSARSPSRPPST